MMAIQHPSWCQTHVLEEDIDGSATDVHQGRVTVGSVTLRIEDSPKWGPDHRPILTPEDYEYTAAGARDLAAALIEAARLVEGDRA